MREIVVETVEDEKVSKSGGKKKGKESVSLWKLTAMLSAKWARDQPFMPWEIKSLDENAIVKHCKKEGRDYWLNHHATLLTRVYPKGTRFDSSNYSPMDGWSMGAQFVALNVQTSDVHQLLNQSMFDQNGGR